MTNEEILRHALEGFVDDDPCALDHHGNCQTHYGDNPCRMVVARDALKSTEPQVGGDTKICDKCARMRSQCKCGDPQIIDGMEQHTGGGTFSGQRTCDKCGHRHPVGQRHDCQAKLVQTVPSVDRIERALNQKKQNESLSDDNFSGEW